MKETNEKEKKIEIDNSQPHEHDFVGYFRWKRVPHQSL